MAKMSKIVWSRLARKTADGSAAHPDANLLAAFAERTLLPRERVTVTAHLAECAECRESLALAFAVEEAPTPAVARSGNASVRGRFREWGGVASAVAACCVVAVALQYYAEPAFVLRNNRLTSASLPAKAAKPSAVETVKAKPVASAVPPTQAGKVRVEHPEDKPAEPALLAAKKEIALEDVPAQVSAPAAPSVDTALGPRRSEAPKADTVSGFVEPERQPAASAVAEQSQTANAAKLASARRGLAAPTSGFVAGAPPPSAALEQSRLASRKRVALKALAQESPRVQWTINASPESSGNSRGVVQRSKDAGETWEDVPLSERVSFRAVAAAGPDVWAGGTEGALFHSSDGGSDWAEVMVASDTAKLSGIIVRIDVRGPSDVRITTDSGEEWISADGGRHWKRR